MPLDDFNPLTAYLTYGSVQYTPTLRDSQSWIIYVLYRQTQRTLHPWGPNPKDFISSGIKSSGVQILN